MGSRDAEELLRAIFAGTHDAILLTARDGTIVDANPAAGALYGRARDALIGRRVTDFAEAGFDAAAAHAAFLAEGHLRHEHRIVRPDGTLRTIEATATARVLPDRQLAFLRDVTDERRARAELYAAEDRRARIFQSCPVATLISTAAEGRLLEVNDAFLALVGEPRERLIGRTSRELGLWVDDGERAPLVAQVLDGRPVHNHETAIRTRRGGIRRILASIDRLELDGQPCLLAVLHDVHEWKQAEERLRTVVQNAPVLLFMTDRQGVFTFFEGKSVDRLGLRAADLVGRSGFELFGALPLTGDDGRPVEPAHVFARVLAGESTTITVGAEAARYEARLLPLRDAAGAVQGLLGVGLDVTERKQLEEQLLQAQKMEAIGQLAGGIAHDFNNMLSAIMGFTGVVQRELSRGDPLQQDLAQVILAAERAAGLTRQLLAFSRKQVLEPRVLEPNALIGTVERLLRRLIGEHVDLRLRLDPALGRVKADAGQVEQVIMNLVVNARDAMPGGGVLTVATANVDVDAGDARQRIEVVPGAYVVVAVSDTGMGMDRATQARIFEPFFTTKELGKGTGLGLSTVYGIVQQSGGHVRVSSEPGRGSTFEVYLPRTEEPGPPAAAPAPPGREARPLVGGETLLVVEDEPLVRALAAQVLERQGYRVLPACDGGEALLQCEIHREEIHLVLSDVVMPGMSGRQLAGRLGRVRPGLRVVYMSGYTEEAFVHHGVLEAGTRLLEKPFTPEALLDFVRRALDEP